MLWQLFTINMSLSFFTREPPLAWEATSSSASPLVVLVVAVVVAAAAAAAAVVVVTMIIINVIISSFQIKSDCQTAVLFFLLLI
ncbi:hypothetical protein [Candidatus Ichthyocystis sparus]|uniref:hypothetical protein n=1 Tax=Candidatus Ichthyocystis sparus TaxID=1561004 RepID=UPI00114633E2|nr:hypothetical protein [Candidatus Ichthyocystis sparus]